MFLPGYSPWSSGAWGGAGQRLGSGQGPRQCRQGLMRVSLPGQVTPEESVAPREQRSQGPSVPGMGGEKVEWGWGWMLFSV